VHGPLVPRRASTFPGVLVDLLEDEFDFVRCATIQTIALFTQRHPGLRDIAVELQAGCLIDDVPSVRAAALAALRDTAEDAVPLPPAVLKSMRYALEDSDEGVRLAAVTCAFMPLQCQLCSVCKWKWAQVESARECGLMAARRHERDGLPSPWSLSFRRRACFERFEGAGR
jgi:hypothetical protein